MFGTFFIEQDPLSFSNAREALVLWTQKVGAVAAVALIIWIILWECGLFRKSTTDVPPWQKLLFRLGLLATALIYIPSVVALIFDVWDAITVASGANGPSQAIRDRVNSLRSPSLTIFGIPTSTYDISLTLGGLVALLTAGLPFFRNVAELRWRRIWALTKLSFKEALRRRVLYAFAGLLLIFLFSSWFIPHKPEDQVRSYVQVVSWGMGPVLLFAATILAAFSIPADIRQQTIHTIVTKPVERFEIVLGRFLGFSALMTLVLAVMSAVSLLYVLRGVDPDAAAESLKAREPLYGSLRFENCGNERGENVGHEWDYRSYITAPLEQNDKNRQTAVWDMGKVADSVARRPSVRCEYSFDIYRTTKGFENKGISCNFDFEVPGHTGTPAEFTKRLDQARRESNKPTIELENELAEEMGVYQKLSQDVTDNHTQSILIPGGLLRAANRATPDDRGASLIVRVTCNDRTQYIGMAKYDLYLRMDDPDAGDDKFRFAMNFFKSSVGLWLRLVLVTGLAVALSTYFSGVIALLLTLMFYVSGIFRDFIGSVAEGSNAGGGPLESMYRLVRGENIVAPLEQTATVKLASFSDIIYRWLIGRLLDIVPDVNRFDLSFNVAEGFNISADQLVLNLLMLILYLLPWAVLAFYLIKWREIAAPS
jgi:ABC-type transport system involved in multi-copper enzyme maturation permease subunit